MTHKLPTFALAVRQPWAWAIIHAGKDIENRDWRLPNYNGRLSRRGRIAIHASAVIGKAEYYTAREFLTKRGVGCPAPCDLTRGGIVGSVEIIDIVSASDSPWFFGPLGLVLKDPMPHEFIAVKGSLGFFRWHHFVLKSRPHKSAPVWMLRA